MPVIASGANVSLSYVLETTRGVTPGSPSMKTLRNVGRNINLSKDLLQSQEVTTNRQMADLRHGFNKIGGTIPVQLGILDYDDMILMAMSGSWANSTTGSTTIAANNTGAGVGTYVLSAGSWRTTGNGFDLGDEIVGSGFTNGGNNVRSKITAISTTTNPNDTITVATTAGGNMVSEAAAAGRTVQLATAATGMKMKIGSTLKTMTAERRFNDLIQYQTFLGAAVNQATISMQPSRIITMSMDLVGISGGAFSGSSLGTPAAAATNPATNTLWQPFSVFNGKVMLGGTQIAIITGLDVVLNNQRTTQPVVGATTTPDVFEGQALVTGQATIFFDSPATVYNLFKNETTSWLDVVLQDVGGTDFHRINLPNVKFNGGMMDPPQTGPVVLTVPFQGLYDVASGSSLIYQKSQ
jgi:hypothetical protein